MEGNLLNLQEVGERIRVPVPTLRLWRQQGKGPKSFKIGRHVAYFEADVSSWLEAQYARSGIGGHDAAA